MRRLRACLSLASRLAIVGSGPRDVLRLFVAGMLEATRPRWHLTRPLRVAIRLEGQRFDVVLADDSDFLVLRGLREREFAIDLARPPAVIVDLGAHIGLVSLFFRARYPEAAIYALEPNPVTYARLRENVAGHGIQTLHGAVAARAGAATLFLGPSSWSSSLVPRDTRRDSVAVRAWTLDELLCSWSITHVDLLKLDIEGAEFEVLRETSVLPRVAAVVAELHYDLAPSSPAEVTSLLAGFELSIAPHGDQRALLRAIRC